MNLKFVVFANGTDGGGVVGGAAGGAAGGKQGGTYFGGSVTIGHGNILGLISPVIVISSAGQQISSAKPF